MIEDSAALKRTSSIIHAIIKSFALDVVNYSQNMNKPSELRISDRERGIWKVLTSANQIITHYELVADESTKNKEANKLKPIGWPFYKFSESFVETLHRPISIKPYYYLGQYS